MKRTLPKHNTKLRFVLVFFVLCGLAASITGVLYFRMHGLSGVQDTIVFAGDPVTIVTLHTDSERAIVTTLPADTVVSSVYEYGSYALSALWKFGFIERNPDLFRLSLQETLGIPIGYFVGQKPDSGDQLVTPENSLSFQGMWRMITNTLATNMTIRQFAESAWVYARLRPEQITRIELTSTDVFREEVLPDGSRIATVNTNRLDYLFGSVYALDSVREEGKRVTVLNTTTVSGLAARAARRLEKMGVYIVSVGISDTALDVCTVRASEDASKSMTVRIIGEQFGCTLTNDPALGRDEVVLMIGEAYAALFESQD